MSLSECHRRNLNKMSPKEPEQNVPEGTKTKFGPLAATYIQNLLSNINTLHIHMHIYPESFIESRNQKFHKSHRQIISYIAGETLLTSNDVKTEE